MRLLYQVPKHLPKLMKLLAYLEPVMVLFKLIGTYIETGNKS